MKDQARRSFISSAATITGLGFFFRRAGYAQSPVLSLKKDYSYVIQPGTLVSLADDGSVKKANAWTIGDVDQDILPFVTGAKEIPLVGDGSILCAPCTADDFSVDPIPIPKRFLEFQLVGELPTNELVSDVVRARIGGQSLDLTLRLDEQISGTYLGESQVSPRGSAVSYFRWQSPQVGGYYIQFRGPDLEGLIPCATDAPQHYHAELWKAAAPKNINLVNLHIAIWKNKQTGQYCFALANSKGWPSCIRICNPTWSSIYQGVLASLLAAGVAYFFAVTLASLLASLLYGSLAALAL